MFQWSQKKTRKGWILIGFQSNEIAASIGKEEKYFPWLERWPSRIRLHVVLLISHGAPLWSSKNTALLPSWLSTHIVQWGARARPESRVAKPCLYDFSRHQKKILCARSRSWNAPCVLSPSTRGKVKRNKLKGKRVGEMHRGEMWTIHGVKLLFRRRSSEVKVEEAEEEVANRREDCDACEYAAKRVDNSNDYSNLPMVSVSFIIGNVSDSKNSAEKRGICDNGR